MVKQGEIQTILDPKGIKGRAQESNSKIYDNEEP